MSLKVALPKGRLLAETSGLLKRAEWGLGGYTEKARLYYLKSKGFPELSARIFQEKDIPIQVAVGNYDIGICGLNWVDELLVKYPHSALVKVKDLNYGQGALHVVTSRRSRISTVADIRAETGTIRIASEYPNLAEYFAVKNRLRRFSIFPLWGTADVYPPENAELALVTGKNGGDSFNGELVPVSRVLDYSAYLIVNRESWERKDLGTVLASVFRGWHASATESQAPDKNQPGNTKSRIFATVSKPTPDKDDENTIWLALPDGHQQSPTVELLNKAGIGIDDYPSTTGNCRPECNLENVRVKVIRPQDMPLQVANGNFALAITGYDWLKEHLYQFPSSPVTKLLDLGFGWVKIVAVISRELPITDINSLRQFARGRTASLRIATEYVNIADRYARENHLGTYRIIPTWGATEAFLPEDADLLIENTSTGQTIARHNLKIIDRLFESTACLIGNNDILADPAKKKRIQGTINSLETALKDNELEGN